MLKLFKYQSRLILFRRIHSEDVSAMHFCDRYRTSAGFDASARQQCVVFKDFEKCELCTRNDRTCDVFKSSKCKFFHLIVRYLSSVLFINLVFAEQRLNRAFAKMKNKRIIAFTEKSRVNKKIRRIFTDKNRIIKKNVKRKRTIYAEKKRVNAKSLKYIIFFFSLLSFVRFFFN